MGIQRLTNLEKQLLKTIYYMPCTPRDFLNNFGPNRYETVNGLNNLFHSGKLSLSTDGSLMLTGDNKFTTCEKCSSGILAGYEGPLHCTFCDFTTTRTVSIEN